MEWVHQRFSKHEARSQKSTPQVTLLKYTLWPRQRIWGGFCQTNDFLLWVTLAVIPQSVWFEETKTEMRIFLALSSHFQQHYGFWQQSVWGIFQQKPKWNRLFSIPETSRDITASKLHPSKGQRYIANGSLKPLALLLVEELVLNIQHISFAAFQ